jgi:hypothetical protein
MLDDLFDPEAAGGIALQMQDRERYFEGQLARTASEQAEREVRLTHPLRSSSLRTKNWVLMHCWTRSLTCVQLLQN